jgi:hypothetical protein
LSDILPIQNGVKQGDSPSPLLFNFALAYTIRKVQVNQVRLKLQRTHYLLVCADGVNFRMDNINTIKKNKETLIDAGTETGLKVNTEKTKYILTSRHQNTGENIT